MKSSHINPEEAVTVFTDLGAKYAIGIHWGTFKLTLEPMDEPPRKLAEALQKQFVKVSTHMFVCVYLKMRTNFNHSHGRIPQELRSQWGVYFMIVYVCVVPSAPHAEPFEVIS